jgi:hypothetical protein
MNATDVEISYRNLSELLLQQRMLKKAWPGTEDEEFAVNFKQCNFNPK